MSAPLELIHLDIHNVNHWTFTGHRYWVTFIDDYTHYQFIFPIKNKLEVLQTFKNFKAYAETQLGHHIKALHDDKEGKYMSNKFRQFTELCGIVCQHTV